MFESKIPRILGESLLATSLFAGAAAVAPNVIAADAAQKNHVKAPPLQDVKPLIIGDTIKGIERLSPKPNTISTKYEITQSNDSNSTQKLGLVYYEPTNQFFANVFPSFNSQDAVGFRVSDSYHRVMMNLIEFNQSSGAVLAISQNSRQITSETNLFTLKDTNKDFEVGAEVKPTKHGDGAVIEFYSNQYKTTPSTTPPSVQQV
jgi:hypothetical protein